MNTAQEPYEVFMTLNYQEQRKYYKSLYITLPATLVSFVKDMSQFESLDDPERVMAFKKLEAITFCIDYLKNEAEEYREFRNFQQHNTEIKKSIETHIEKAIFHLNKLKYNKENIQLLQSITIKMPPNPSEYYTEIETIAINALERGGHSPNKVKRLIMPLIRDTIRGKEI